MRNGWRYQLGSSMSDGFAWKTLFHKSENLKGFDNTKDILCELLNKEPVFTDDYLKDFIDKYTANCECQKEYPWTYYYIKYRMFRTGRYGKYWWNDFENAPYVFTTLYQRQKPSENSYNPFLKAVNDNVWREYYGNYIYINEGKSLKETQSLYIVVSNDKNEAILNEIKIEQNSNKIDTENRIEKMRNEYKDIF